MDNGEIVEFIQERIESAKEELNDNSIHSLKGKFDDFRTEGRIEAYEEIMIWITKTN